MGCRMGEGGERVKGMPEVQGEGGKDGCRSAGIGCEGCAGCRAGAGVQGVSDGCRMGARGVQGAGGCGEGAGGCRMGAGFRGRGLCPGVPRSAP